MKRDKTKPFSSCNFSKKSISFNPLNTVLADMSGQAITNGWDAVCAINIDKANELFALRFADTMAKGLDNNSLVLSGTSSDGSVVLNTIVLSQPLIQISTDVSGSNINLSFILLAGTITTSPSDNIGTIGSTVNITPDLDLQLTAVVPIVSALATTNSDGQILFDVSDTSFTIKDILWDSLTQQAISNYVSILIKNQNLSVDFPIATIPASASGALVPQLIKFATQQNSTDLTDTGRLLILMSTSFNSNGGSQNFLSVANVVPDSITDNNGNVILIDNALIISANVFIQSFTNSLTTALSAYDITFNIGQSDNLPNITSDSGTFTTQTPPFCWDIPPVEPQNPTFYSIGWMNVSIPFNKVLSISFANTNNVYQLSLQSSSSQTFDSHPNNDGYTCLISNAGDGTDTLNGTLNVSGVQNIGVLQPNDNTVSFQLQGNAVNASLSVDSHWYDFFGDENYKYVDNGITSQVGTALQSQLTSTISAGIPSINTFVLENFLFSQDQQIQMQAAYLPGDIAIFGTTQMPNWYLSASDTSSELPIAVVKAGNSITISSNGTGIPKQVSWTNSSSIGTVTPESLNSATYTAPTTVMTAQVVIINANDSSNSGFTTALPLIIVPNSIIISPNFAVIEAGSDGLAFVASASFYDTVNWTSSNPNAYITFNQASSMTPQVFAGNYSSTQFTTITVTDTTNNDTGSAYILTIPSFSHSINMQQIIQEGAPGDTISITALSKPNSSPVTSIASWQQFDEDNISGVTLPSNEMTISFTIPSDAAVGSTIFIVASVQEAIPSAVTAVVVTSNNSNYNK
jgi:hypothetical protein